MVFDRDKSRGLSAPQSGIRTVHPHITVVILECDAKLSQVVR